MELTLLQIESGTLRPTPGRPHSRQPGSHLLLDSFDRQRCYNPPH
jgi:hypothetical protein